MKSESKLKTAVKSKRESHPASRWSKSAKATGWVLIIFATATVIFAANRTDQRPQEQPDLPNSDIVLQSVGVMAPISTDDSFTPLRYTAMVVARRKSQLSFQASERVDQLLVEEGDRVEAGQLLAVQDSSAIAAQHDAAVAQQRQSAAVLAELRQGPREETIEVAKAELSRLNARSKLARTTLARQQRLQQTRAGSQQELDIASSEYSAMQAAVTSARERLKELQSGTRQEQIDAQEAALEMAVARTKQSQVRLDQTRLYAPFTGQISRRFIDEGSLPQRGSPAFEIVEVDHLEVRFGVATGVARQLKRGQKLAFDSGSITVDGTVAQINPTLDRATRTQEIIVNVDAGQRENLVDGQTVRIEFAAPTTEPGMWLPTEALRRQVRGLWSVLVIEKAIEGDDLNHQRGQTAVRRDVELLATWGQWSRVRGTVEPTDLVIVSGSSRVSDGQRVEVQPIDVASPWDQSTVQLNDRSAP